MILRNKEEKRFSEIIKHQRGQEPGSYPKLLLFLFHLFSFSCSFPLPSGVLCPLSCSL
ncbi:hypothetical protein GCWU000341_01126 [Oribacterium sp. oral taxon 078 str. F0262]|nr:hypothetical protein GCWU000341_01126 [Oribacterium sp. oral taxon 078 str. F0262]